MITVPPLYQLCAKRLASFLKTTWVMPEEDTRGNRAKRRKVEDSVKNYFQRLPTLYVQDILEAVLETNGSNFLRSKDLYFLLTSNRLVNFRLGEDVSVADNELYTIFHTLSQHCEKLKSIEIACGCLVIPNHIYLKNALVNLIKEASDLEYLQCDATRLEFEFSSFQTCSKLRVLKIWRAKMSKFEDLLAQEDGTLAPNDQLQVLHVYNYLSDNRGGKRDLKFCVSVLQYCTALTHFNVNIAPALMHLHLADMNEGLLGATYKLQKCTLGDYFHPASAQIVRLATLACPSLAELCLMTSEPATIEALGGIRLLHSLDVQWQGKERGDFRATIQPLVRRVGGRLKKLKLVNFRCIDLTELSVACPNLEDLNIECCSEEPPSCQAPTGAAFRLLRRLYLSCLCPYGLRLCLSDCLELEAMRLEFATRLTDSLLEDIVRKNPLRNLREARIDKCALTGRGVRCLASHLTSLKKLGLNSKYVIHEEARKILHNVNPKVTMHIVR